jgi:transmembrane sensor
MKKSRDRDGEVESSAAYWFARLRSDRAGASERRRFARWASGDDSRLSEYGKIDELWDELGDMAADEAILAMRKDALRIEPASRSGNWRKLAAAAALFFIFVAIGLSAIRQSGWMAPPSAVAQAELYRTDVGERSTVTLRDGSVVELNTDTVLQADFSGRERDVRLLKGQALFQVAHDKSRPFVVRAAGQRVTAVGTMFDVRVDSGKMRVTLLEGVVKVEHDDGAAPASAGKARVLEAGEQLAAASEQPFRVTRVDPVQTVSWRTGQVIFSDQPLGEVVAEINRYSRQKVILDDPSLADLRVSGVFRAGSTGNFVAALSGAFPIRSERGAEDDTIVLKWNSRRPA